MNPLNPIDILLVEDNPQDAELTIRAFKRHNLANRLFTVEDGAEALDFVFGRGRYAKRDMSRPLKIILLDLKLPKMTGLQVLQAIKADERTHNTPVVMITSSGEEPDIRAAYKLGANSYVVKPVEFGAFMEVMSHLGFYWLLANEVPGRETASAHR